MIYAQNAKQHLVIHGLEDTWIVDVGTVFVLRRKMRKYVANIRESRVSKIWESKAHYLGNKNTIANILISRRSMIEKDICQIRGEEESLCRITTKTIRIKGSSITKIGEHVG